MPIPNEEIPQHLPLVTFIVNKMQYWPLEYDDAIAWGTYGLLKAARKFDPSRNIKFATYASIRIAGEVADRKRSLIGGRYTIAPIPQSLERICEAYDFNVSDTTALEHESKLENENLAVHLISVLSLREKKIIYLYYIVRKPFWQIAEILGISEGRAVQLHKKALERMRMAAA